MLASELIRRGLCDSLSLPLLLHDQVDDAVHDSAVWRINGYPARILLWTAEEFGRLEHPPLDAQFIPCGNGVWCALRLE